MESAGKLTTFGNGFIRVAAAVPRLRIADCAFNAGQMLDIMCRAEDEAVALLTFPELSLTGYTCADLFHQRTLREGAIKALNDLAQATASRFSGICLVGLPLAVDDQIFNCAAVLNRGRILGVVPKSFIPNYTE